MNSNSLKNKILLKLYGSKFLEAYFADSYLTSFADGIPRTDLPTATGDLAFTTSRVDSLLLSESFLEPFGNGFVITSKGKMHLDKGGYIDELINHSASKICLYISVPSAILSIAALLISLLK